MPFPDIELEDERCTKRLWQIIGKSESFENEEWRFVVTPKFNSQNYMVSDLGRVLSLPRYRQYDETSRTKVRHAKFLPGGLMKTGTQPSGHLTITLIHDKKRFSTHLHRLVAWAFLGPQPPNYYVRHMDGNPGNNKLSNLEYGMPWENITDSYGPAGITGIGIVIGSSLERRINSAINGNGNAINVLLDIQNLLKKSRDKSSP